MYTSAREESRKIMPNALAERPCSETVLPESQDVTKSTDTWPVYAGCVGLGSPPDPEATSRQRLRGLDQPPLCPAQVAADRSPFGWKPSPHDPMLLIQDPAEEGTIWFLMEAAQNPAWGPRALCRWLDSQGRKRRGGKKWVDGGHSLVTAILKR